MDFRLIVIGFGSLFQFTHAFCSLGSFECIDITRYNGRQYATCLTNQYIRQVSDYKHRCENAFATVCWYQCMLEVHDVNYGDVTPDCSCAVINTTVPPEDLLPPECYSPSGEDCNWYKDCLEKRYPCIGKSVSYAFDYARRFCVLYGKNYNEFSSSGQTWIDAVRKCLQVKLVPALRPGQEKNCEQLMDFAFGTHGPCYLSPERGVSVCNLPEADYLKIFWTLNEGYKSLWKQNQAAFWKAMLPTFKQLIDIGAKCVLKWVFNAVIELGCYVQNGIDNASNWSKLRRRRDVIKTNVTMEDIVFKITIQIAETMLWEEKQVMWFGYPVTNANNTENNTSNITMRIILAPKAMYDLEAQNVTLANVTEAVDDLSQAIDDGVMVFDLGDGVDATFFRVCDDNDCANSTFETVAQNKQPLTKNTSEEAESKSGLYIGVSVGSAAVICIIIIVFVLIFRRK